MGRQRVKEGPPGRGDNVFVHNPITKTSRLSTQVDVTFHNVYDELELPEHEVQEPEDAHKKGKLCLILSRHDLVKTRSVKTFHEVCFCLTPHVNFFSDRVRGFFAVIEHSAFH